MSSNSSRGIERFDANFLTAIYLRTTGGPPPDLERVAKHLGREPSQVEEAYAMMIAAGWYEPDGIDEIRRFLVLGKPFEPRSLMDQLARNRTLAPSSPLLAKLASGAVAKPKLWHGTHAEVPGNTVEPGHGSGGLKEVYATPNLDLAKVYALSTERVVRIASTGPTYQQQVFAIVADRESYLSDLRQSGGGAVYQVANDEFRPHRGSLNEWVSDRPAAINTEQSFRVSGLDALRDSKTIHFFFGPASLKTDSEGLWTLDELTSRALPQGLEAAHACFDALVRDGALTRW